MNRYLNVGLVVLAIALSPALAEESVHGQKPEMDKSTAIADILAKPHDFEGTVVQVRGKVTEVCTNMGCWLRVGDAEGSILLAKSTGDKITVPTDSAGRAVVVEGTVVVEHEEEGSHEGEPEGHSCPTATVRLETRGVQLL